MSEDETRGDIRFVHNTELTSHLVAFKQACSLAESVTVCVAYLKMSGLSMVMDTLNELITSGVKLTVIVGTDQYLTEPSALYKLSRLIKQKENAEGYLVPVSKSTFHPKLLYAENRENAHALIGSANMTRGGMQTNVEASIYAKIPRNSSFCRQIDTFLISVRKTTKPLEVVAIGQYEGRYDVYKKRRDKADKEAARELAALPDIDEKSSGST